MGTLNISSMDLHAVNVPVRRPAQAKPKPKRPKFRAPEVSRTKKCVLVISAASLILAAFVLPPANDAKQVRQIAPTVQTDGELAPAPLEAQPQRLLSSEIAASKIKQSGFQSRKKELEPLSQALPFAPSTASDVSIALNVLASYIQNGSPEQKQEATLRIGEYRREHLHLAICEQIRNNESPALAVFAELATQQKPDGAVDALIERLNSTQRKVYARSELIRALCQFVNDPKASTQLLTMLNMETISDRDLTWSQLGVQLPPAFVKLALQRVIKGDPDAASASQALARYGSTIQAAMQIVSEVEHSLTTGSQPTRTRVIQLLAGLNESATSARLRMLTSDTNDEVRAAALKALAGNPDNAEVVVTALQNDSSNRVKESCIDGLGSNPSPMALSELINLLSSDALRHHAKRALVLANKGKDLGWQDLEWRAWLENSNAQRLAETGR